MADVYVVEKGHPDSIDGHGVVGVYASRVAAIAAHPIPENPRKLKSYAADALVGVEIEPYWGRVNETRWSNHCDYDDAITVTRYEVQE